MGRRAVALVDRSDPVAGSSRGRLQWQADDIDGVTWIDSAQRPGSFVEVAITDVRDDYDYGATVVREIPEMGATPLRAGVLRTSLPLAPSGSHTFGR